ncbi:IS30 family transposase [Mycoplasmopsis bovis]|uniref:IS30 family transposase n=1 Tax=Mycoplasmopsis bovis TaxID=28903 RepID=UPI00287F818E|nr:IS30 family transposase [Mycoplasmopsis bovis]WNA90926.1 IS30 family transposase [Mycoplasmopsis bovis]
MTCGAFCFVNEYAFIEIQIKSGYSIRSIARQLNRSPSTVSRELKRNTAFSGSYQCKIAEQKALNRHSHKYLFKFTSNFEYAEFEKFFLEKFDKRFYGIVATARYIKQTFPNIASPSIRTIFNWIKTRKWKLKPRDRLRIFYKKGGKRTASVVSRLIGDSHYVYPIWARPKYIDLREEYGHWESDLIIGKRSNGYDNVLTLVERQTRMGFAVKIKSKSAFLVISKLKKIIQDHNLIVKSITIDNGIEFERMGLLGKWLNIKIFRAEPYASFQRGTNENWNGMIRRMFHKGFDFNSISQVQLDDVVNQINEMPRKILNWQKPIELFKLANDYGVVLN